MPEGTEVYTKLWYKKNYVMKALFMVSILLGISIKALAQEIVLTQRRDIDSLFSENIKGYLNTNQFPDSLLPPSQRIDAISDDFNLAADGIRTHYQNTLSAINAQTKQLNNTIDSLGQLNLPLTSNTKKLDSLNAVRLSTENKCISKLSTLKANTIGKLNSFDLPPEYKESLQRLTKKVADLNLNSDIIKAPALNIPGFSLPKIGGIGDFSSKAGDIGNVHNLGNIPNIKTPSPDLDQLTQQAAVYQEDFKNISQGNLSDVQPLPETIEAQASKIEGIEELQKQSGLIDEYKNNLEAIKDTNTAKEKAVAIAKEVAVNHFAGKQEKLKAAMEKISKYKQKYSSVSSLKDLPKRPPNPMKGKPFVERLVPGLYFQYQQKNSYLIDIKPHVCYKITGRLISGFGWNNRYGYERKTHTWNKRSIIFGPRGYVDFKLGKGFIAHLEGERMNTFVPSTIFGNPDTGHREWVWSFMTGLKKEYRIYKNLKGTALIQYNLFNRYYKAPYVDRLNSRIGFEYVLKKKKDAKK